MTHQFPNTLAYIVHWYNGPRMRIILGNYAASHPVGQNIVHIYWLFYYKKFKQLRGNLIVSRSFIIIF